MPQIFQTLLELCILAHLYSLPSLHFLSLNFILASTLCMIFQNSLTLELCFFCTYIEGYLTMLISTQWNFANQVPAKSIKRNICILGNNTFTSTKCWRPIHWKSSEYYWTLTVLRGFICLSWPVIWFHSKKSFLSPAEPGADTVECWPGSGSHYIYLCFPSYVSSKGGDVACVRQNLRKVSCPSEVKVLTQSLKAWPQIHWLLNPYHLPFTRVIVHVLWYIVHTLLSYVRL